jgi:DNA repair exonuclease SbcCD ATPase subunit
MSQNDSPISPAFEFQRTALEQTHRVLERSVEFQQDLNGALLESFDSAVDVSGRGDDLIRRGVDAYFDALETAVPGDSAVLEDLRGNVDEQLDALEESRADALERIEENLQEGSESVDEFLDTFIERLDEQVQSLLETSEDLEAETVEALENLEEQIDELQSQIEEQTEALQQQVDDATDRVGDSAA